MVSPVTALCVIGQMTPMYGYVCRLAKGYEWIFVAVLADDDGAG